MRVNFIILLIIMNRFGGGKTHEKHNFSLNDLVSQMTGVNSACSIFILDFSEENSKMYSILQSLQEQFRVLNYQNRISSWIHSLEMLRSKTCIQTLVFGPRVHIESFFRKVWDRSLTNDPYTYFVFVKSLSDVNGLQTLMDIVHVAIVYLPSSKLQNVVNVYQINPYADEKFILTNIWSNNRSDFIRKFDFNDQNRNLMGYNLRVAYMKHPPYLFQISSNIVDGFEKRIVEGVGESLGSNIELVESIDGKWGGIDQNGSWNGIIGMAQRKEVDVAIGALTRQFEREMAIDFTTGHSEQFLTFLTRAPQELPKWHSLLWPFEKNLWYMILITMVLFSISFVAILQHIHEEKKIRISMTFINIWGSFLNQGIIHPKRVSLRIILGTWFLYSFCTIASYSGSLISFLTLSNMEKPINTLEELAGSNLNIMIMDGLFYKSLFQFSEDATYKKIGGKLSEASEKGYICVNQLNCLKTVNEKKEIAYISDGDSFMNFYLKKHDFQFIYISKAKFYTSEYAIVLRKNFPILKHFNQKIQLFLEMGLIQKWKEDFSQVYLNKCDRKEKRTGRVTELRKDTDMRPPISLNHLQGIFLVASIGLGMSLIVFIGEKLLFYSYT